MRANRRLYVHLTTLLAIAALAATAGCGGSAATSGQPDTEIDHGFATDDLGPGDDGAGTDEGGEPVDQGSYGSPCTGAEDCTEGECLGTGGNKACTKLCTGGCPAGTACLPVSDELDLCLPTDVDTDFDTVINLNDSCPLAPNKNQQDMDDDAIGDACDSDRDGDGETNETDCDPGDPDVSPEAVEVCDGFDNDCDGTADDVSCSDDNPCTTDTCLGAQGCKHDPNSDPCNDGNACTENDVCSFGECAGTFVSCDDKNSCTNDTCDTTSGCVHTAISGSCDDGNICTSGDKCEDGACVGTPGLCGCESVEQCEDGNPCTTDICDAEVGCTWSYNTNPCDDGNPCTLADTCAAGICQGTVPNKCDDLNPCTTDVCDTDQGCVNTPNTNPCSDGNACTLEDKCSGGSCGGSPLVCDDGLACTSDSCDSATGCVYMVVTGPCDDGDPCTAGDMCKSGICEPGAPKSCDDGNPCTADSCNPSGGGCVNAPLDGGSCDDGSDCTTGDQCVAGQCKGTATQGCCNSDADCDDGNPCTKDSCNTANGQCTSSAELMNGFGCNADNNGCTEGDTCQGGVCHVGEQVDCSDQSNDCNTATCTSTGVTTYFCGLTPRQAGTPCEDGLYCTVGDTCDAEGACAGGGPRDCSGAGGGCIVGECNEQEKACTGDSLADGTPCNADNNGCTVSDTCQGGNCIAGDPADCSWLSSECIVGVCVPAGAESPHNYDCESQFKPQGTPCEDGQFCTTGDACDAAGWCESGGPNPCTEVANQCNTGSCDEDGDVCNSEPIADGTSCNDGDSCSLGDTCQSGECKGTENICGEYKVSTFETGLSGYAPAIADKGDGEYGIFWQDDSGDWVNGRSYSNSWSKEWTEFEVDGGQDDLSVDAAGMPDGGLVLARTHRAISYSQTSKSCSDQYSGCDDGKCSCSYSCYTYTKYSGNKRREERIYLSVFDHENQLVNTISVYDDTDTSSWSYSCSSKGGYTYTSTFGNVKVTSSPSGLVFVMFQVGSSIRAKLYNANGSLIQDYPSLGSSWDGYDIAAHNDDSFIMVWSSGGDIFGQVYSSTGAADGAQLTITNAADAQTDPALDTYTNGRFVVAWRDGSNTVLTRVFKKEGTPVGPQEIVANTTVESVATPDVGAYDLAGSFVVVWQGGSSIRAQFFDKNAGPIGDEKLVNIKADASRPRVTALSTDEAVIAWRTSDGHIRARKYAPNGDALDHSSEIIVNQNVDYEQSSPDGARQADLGFVAVWQTGTADNDLQIAARRFDTNGAPIADELVINATSENWQTAPAVATATNGDFVAAWESFAQDGDVEGVFARQFNADGTAKDDEIPVNVTTDYEQFEPDIAVDRTAGVDGAFAVTWTSFQQPGGAVYDVMVRCFDASGNPLSNELMVNETTDADQQMPAITYLPAGPSRYIVTWASKNEDGDNWGIYARRISASCQPQGLQFPVNTYTTNVQSQPAITAASDGSFLISWRSLGQDGSNYGIYFQRFDNGGNPIDVESPFNAVTANEQSSPAVQFLSDDSLVAGWMTLGEDEQSSAVKFKHHGPDLVATNLEYLGNIYYQQAQDSPAIIPLPNAHYVIMWRSDGQDGDAGSIVGRVLP